MKLVLALLFWGVMVLLIVRAAGCGGASIDPADAGRDCGPGHAGEIVCLGAHGG